MNSKYRSVYSSHTKLQRATVKVKTGTGTRKETRKYALWTYRAVLHHVLDWSHTTVLVFATGDLF